MGEPPSPRRNRCEGNLLEAIQETLRRHEMVRTGEVVMVAVSGGVDSMCLLDVLHRLSDSWRVRLIVAHVNHGLRGEEADLDFRFVEQQARGYAVPFEGRRVDPATYGGLSNVQAKARALRYAFLEEAAQKWGAHRIATGHHRDDQVETLLIQLFRGAGSLQGILPVRDDRFIRPLLEVSRREIERYAAENGIAYREDSSNARTGYLRNRLRLRVIPLIRDEINPSFDTALLHLASILHEEEERLQAVTREVFGRICRTEPGGSDVILEREPLQDLHVAVQRRVLRLAWERLTGSKAGLSYSHVQSICEALAGRHRKAYPQLVLSKGVRVFFDRQGVRFSCMDLWRQEPYRYPLVPGETLYVQEAGLCLRADPVEVSSSGVEPLVVTYGGPADGGQVLLDPGPGNGSMVVRNFRPGDRFRPLGLGGHQKLKEYFIDRHVPRDLRYRVPIVEIDGEIAWLVGFRLDERFKATVSSTRCLRITAQAQTR